MKIGSLIRLTIINPFTKFEVSSSFRLLTILFPNLHLKKEARLFSLKPAIWGSSYMCEICKVHVDNLKSQVCSEWFLQNEARHPHLITYGPVDQYLSWTIPSGIDQTALKCNVEAQRIFWNYYISILNTNNTNLLIQETSWNYRHFSGPRCFRFHFYFQFQ